MIVLSKESLKTFENSLKQSLAHSNPVLLLFIKRIYKVLVKGILHLPYQDILPQFSLHSRSQVSLFILFFNLIYIIFMTCFLIYSLYSINLLSI